MPEKEVIHLSVLWHGDVHTQNFFVTRLKLHIHDGQQKFLLNRHTQGSYTFILIQYCDETFMGVAGVLQVLFGGRDGTWSTKRRTGSRAPHSCPATW